jgi:carboxymethylenebutenolidase
MTTNAKVGDMGVFVATPAGTPRAAIIVVPEIFGVNPGIERKCRKLADDGYLAVAPELFWRFAPGVELDADVPEELQQAFGYFGQYDPNDGVVDIEATIKAIRAGLPAGKEEERAGIAGNAPVAKVGLVGYCLGGKLAYMAAARTDVDASVGYYGVHIDQMLDEKHAIANPLMLHIAGADHLVPPEAQAAVHTGLDDHPRVTLCDYPGLDHGFATETGERRDEAGATLADGRTAAFFSEHLA